MIDLEADAIVATCPEPPADVAEEINQEFDRLSDLVHRLIHEATGCPLGDCSHTPTILVQSEPPAWTRYVRSDQP